MDIVGAAAVVGAIVGLSTFLTGAWTAIGESRLKRKQFTFESISRLELDHEFIKGKHRFRAAITQHKLVELTTEEGEYSNDSLSIRTFLNQFEIISVGIQCGVIDFATYKILADVTVHNYWTDAAPFVVALQTKRDDPNLYSEFRRLDEWLSGGVRPPRDNWWNRLF